MSETRNRWIFLAIRIVIFTLAIGFVYYKVFHNKDIDIMVDLVRSSVSDANNAMLLSLCCLLMLANWGFEAIKWRHLLSEIQKISLWTATKAVFTGVGVSIFTPNRLGSFLGRIIYIRKESRVLATIATFYGNLAQLVVTLVLGTVALLIISFAPNLMDPDLLLTGLIISSLLTIIFVTMYIRPRWIHMISSRIKWFSTYNDRIDAFTQIPDKVKWRVIEYSIRRYIVFTLQYVGLIVIFSPEAPLDQIVVLTMILWVAITFVPTPFLGKLGVRETVALFLFTGLVSDEGIVAASFCIWLINVAAPAVIGGVFALRTRSLLADG